MSGRRRALAANERTPESMPAMRPEMVVVRRNDVSPAKAPARKRLTCSTLNHIGPLWLIRRGSRNLVLSGIAA